MFSLHEILTQLLKEMSIEFVLIFTNLKTKKCITLLGTTAKVSIRESHIDNRTNRVKQTVTSLVPRGPYEAHELRKV